MSVSLLTLSSADFGDIRVLHRKRKLSPPRITASATSSCGKPKGPLDSRTILIVKCLATGPSPTDVLKPVDEACSLRVMSGATWITPLSCRKAYEPRSLCGYRRGQLAGYPRAGSEPAASVISLQRFSTHGKRTSQLLPPASRFRCNW